MTTNNKPQPQDDEGLVLDLMSLVDDVADDDFSAFDQGLFIGMMSGTSLDGIDAVLCRFEQNEQSCAINVIDSISTDIPKPLHAALLGLTMPDGVSAFMSESLEGFQSELDVFGWASVEYAKLCGQIVNALLHQNSLTFQDIVAIGCHGQTVRHRPQWQFSLQLLDPNALAEATGITVVSDFRRRDMAVGGQGAPLVPAFHQAIFGHQAQAVLNLGGIANLTILSQDAHADIIGFDTGCANLLLDGWVQRHTGAKFDKDGQWAKQGQIIEPLLTQLLKHPFFGKPYPKSTGREEFNLAWLDSELEKFNQTHATNHQACDVQATLTELTAISVAQSLTQILPNGRLLVCGGGALNTHLMDRLKHHLKAWQVSSTQALGLSPILIEGLAFAWLARQSILGKPSNVPSVTGANKAVVLGQVCFG